MLAPTDEDDPDRIWPRPYPRKRLWRNRGLLAAAWTAVAVSALMQVWELGRTLIK